MLTGNLVRVKMVQGRVVPLYLRRDDPYWLEIAETLLQVYRDGEGRTRQALEDEILDLVGEGARTLAHRGLAKVIEDRAEFEVVASVPPPQVREAVFQAAADHRAWQRQQPLQHGQRPHFDRRGILQAVAAQLNLSPEEVEASLFADLKDENRIVKFADLSAQRLLDRYNVALAQAVLLRAVRVDLEVRNEPPARYRQLFRWLKFHRLLYQVEGSMAQGYRFHLDGPLSLFQATNRYGLQMALFLPAALQCHQFRLEAELRWGPGRDPRAFLLSHADGLVSHQVDAGVHQPAEVAAFIARLRQLALDWEITDTTELIELGREGVWVPDLRCVHRASGVDVFVEVLGFWKKASVERLLRLLPRLGPPRYILALSDRLKVDEESLGDDPGKILRFREIPSAAEMLSLLDAYRAACQAL